MNVDQSLNPAVVLLEMENAELRRKVTFLEHLLRRFEAFSTWHYDHGLELQATTAPAVPNLVLPMRAEIAAALDARDYVKVVATTRFPDSKGIGIRYYTNREQLSPRDQAALLTILHENFVHQLADLISDERIST